MDMAVKLRVLNNDRALVVASYASFAGAALTRALGETYPIMLPAFAILAVATAMFAYRLMRGDLWRIAHEEDRKLDEREIVLRNRAYRSAYITLSSVALLALVYWQIASDAGLWLPQGEAVQTILIAGAFLFSLTLPSAVLAWIAPPRLPEEG
ncbi:MAG: hypothetical protein JNM70_20800 [Anaerolineae bacterium]|nr:hypothetical protein [Anaerolineae bacterium]